MTQRAPLNADTLETFLGNPRERTNPFGWGAALDAASREDARDREAETLAGIGLRRAMIPESWGSGGTLSDMGELMRLARRLTARDPSLMPRTMFSIGPVCVLDMVGTPTQRTALSEMVLAGRDASFGLSEPETRSDLPNASLQATKTNIGWTLTGKKWLIGRAENSDAVLTLAKTGAGGPTAYSMFLAPRGPQIKSGPQARLTGMRGIDVADLHFDAAPAGPMVGMEGMGLELAFRAQGPVKALSVAASLGPTETALRLANATPDHHSHRRMLLAEALVDHLIVDAMASGSMRILANAPRQFSMWASVTKAQAISLSPRVFETCAQIMGARSALQADHSGALMDKMRRDADIVRVIDINEVMNLRAMATQLDAILARRAKANAGDSLAKLRDALSTDGLSNLAKTQIVNMGGDWNIEALPAISEALSADGRLHGEARGTALVALTALLAQLDAIAKLLPAIRKAYPDDYANRPELIRAAQRYARIHAGAGIAALFLSSAQSGMGPSSERGEWLALALARLAHGEEAPSPQSVWEGAWAMLCDCHASNRAPSIHEMSVS